MTRPPAAASLRASRPLLVPLVALLVGAATLMGVPPAQAAGQAVLDLELTPINASTGDTITDAQDGTNGNFVTYRVQYSCTTAACDNTRVQMSAAPPDPNGLLPDGEWILKYSSWVAPAGGGTIGGTDITGKLVTLGNLAAGTSGTFTVTYAYQSSTGREVPNGSFYPEGFQIGMSAEATADTAVAPVATDASAVTWHIGVPTGPTSGVTPTGGTFKTDTQVTYQLAMNPGNMTAPGSCLSGSAAVAAVGSYRVVYTVPAEAVIDAASDGGVVDNATHTVTWTTGALNAPSYAARGGWGIASTGGFNCGGPGVNNTLRATTDDDAFFRARTVTVTYPGANFPQADPDGCNFTANLTSTLDVAVSYLDSATTQKSSTRTIPSKVACTTPFGGIAADKRISNGAAGQFSEGDMNLGGNPQVFAVNMPGPGQIDPGNREWRVVAANLGNVDATAVIDEPDLVQDHLKVYRIYAYKYAGAPAGWQATVDWVDNTGATGTATLGDLQFVEAATGRWFVSAHTTAPLAAGRILPTDGTQTSMQMGYRFHADTGAPVGERRTNTAHVDLVYPDDADGDGDADDYTTVQGVPLPTRTVSVDASRTAQYTQATPVLTASFVGAPVVAGGGNPKVGTEVTYAMRGRTDNVYPSSQIRPQLVFVAPAGWDIVPGSAVFTGNGTGQTTTAPAGTTFSYATRTIGGVDRKVVVATWPGPVSPSPTVGELWPTLSVKATPTSAALAGSGVVAQVYAGDQSGAWRITTPFAAATAPTQFRAATTGITDAPDVDADGDVGEAYATTNSAAVIVGATDGVAVVKELCVPDSSAGDGCHWVSDPSQVAGVPVGATDVKYRITLRNSGNTTLHNAVAYDVLPYPGDTGLLSNPSPRGSQFAMTLSGITSVDPGVTLDYSASTNPARPEVNPGAAGTVDDWGPGVAGKKAIRIRLDGNLGADASKQVVFTAAVTAGATAGQVACNTAAIDSNETLPVEPPAVCVKLAEADLEVQAGTLTPWEIDQATTIPFAVVNHGGTPGADASVALSVPLGMRVDDLAPTGWACTAPGNAPAPVAGPVSLTCTPVTGSGDPRTLALEAPEQLVLAVTPTTSSATAVCVVADITGPLYDPVPANNEDDACQPVAPPFVPAPALTIDKSSVFANDANGNGKADRGDVLTYTFHVENTGNVDVTGVTIDDSKVAATTPASADIAKGAARDFAAAYTVTQADVDAGGTHNTATATGAPSSGGTVTSDLDSDDVPGPDAVADVTVVKSATISTDSGTAGKADVGDVITYTFTVHNDGPATAHDVSVTDPLTGLSSITPQSVATVAPGAEAVFTATYTVTQSDVDRGSVTNRATARFTDPTPPGGPAPAPRTEDSNQVVVDAAAAPMLTIDKSSVFASDANGDGKADKDDVLTYTFHVVNTGNVTLTGVVVDDALPGLGAISPGPATLAPGDSADFTASYTVRQSDVDAGSVLNEATATGTPSTGPPVTSAPDTDEVDGPDVATGHVTVVKSAKLTTDRGEAGKADVGDVITYTFTVHNAGPATALDVAVHDPLRGLSAITPTTVASVAPGADAVFTATYRVTAADTDRGAVRNQAVATYTPPTPRGGPAAQPLTTPSNVVETPTAASTPRFDLTLRNRLVTASRVRVGDPVRYRLLVSNRGPDPVMVPIVLKNVLPDGLRLVAAHGRHWDCTLRKATDSSTCTRDVAGAARAAGAVNLAVGRHAPPVIVVARATARAHGRLVDSARVRAAGDSVRANNGARAVVTVVVPQPELPDTGYRLPALRWRW